MSDRTSRFWPEAVGPLFAATHQWTDLLLVHHCGRGDQTCGGSGMALNLDCVRAAVSAPRNFVLFVTMKTMGFA